MALYALLAVALFLILFGGFVFLARQRRDAAVLRRVDQAVAEDSDEDEEYEAPTERLVEGAAGFATRVRSKLGQRLNDSIQVRMESAGIRVPMAADLYFVARIGFPILVGGAAYLAFHKVLVAMVAAIVGWMAPEFALDRMIKRYRVRIHRAMPDVVDLLSVCVEAGLGLDQALLRTAREMNLAYPEICGELIETNRERQAGLTRADAWKNLIERTQSEDIDMMMTMFQQADELGTPMTVALRTFSDSLRSTRCNLAKEKAKRAGILVMGPLVLFIFPTLFAVLLAPAAIEVMKGLHALTMGAKIP